MNSLKKLDRDRTLADLASVNSLLDSLDVNDFVARLELEERQRSLTAQIAKLDDADFDGAASISLFFGGSPVLSNRGIDADFAGEMVTHFQDLLAKYVAQSDGELGQRGVVPNLNASRLHITNVVRGSFGFHFEELDTQPELVATPLSEAVDNLAEFLDVFTEVDEGAFAEKLESVDQRVLASTKSFFDVLRSKNATLRLVAGDHDSQFGAVAIERAADRADNSSITESETSISGIFLAALPEGHRFEMRRPTEQDVLSGYIDKEVSAQQISEFNREFLNKRVRAHGVWKRIQRNGNVVRETFKLRSLEIDG